MNETQQRTLQYYKNLLSVKNKHPSWLFSHIREFNRRWNRDLLLYPCQVCGYSKHIELAHIKPITSFEEEALVSVVNSPENLFVLCPNHHWEFDHDELTEEIKPRTQKVLGKNTCPDCFSYKTRCSKHCFRCSKRFIKMPTKIKWMSPQELQQLVWAKPTTEIAKIFGVSDVAIAKRCKKLGIKKPPRGYWSKLNIENVQQRSH